MKPQTYSVYIVASKSRVIYIGVTNNLERRIYEHKNNLVDGFSKDYRCHRLVYYESFDGVLKPSTAKSNSSAGTEQRRFV